MDVSYKFLSRDEMEKYIKQIKKWDTKRYFCSDYRDEDLFGLFSLLIGGFIDDKFISYGQIQFMPTLKKGFSLSLSYIVSPEYRRKGYGTDLVNYMVNYCQSKYERDYLTVDILKKNKESISIVEKNDFEFVSFDNKTITYKKKLINK